MCAGTSLTNQTVYFIMKNSIQKSIKLVSAVFIIFLILVIFAPAYVLPTYGEGYSTGARSGILQKYSVKGVFSKTGEGQLILPSTNGSIVNDVFNFSADQTVNLDSLIGKHVVLEYSQAANRNWREGDTPYKLVSIRPSQ